MLACAAGTRLLARSARDGVISHAALTDTLEVMRRPSIEPLAAFALWFVARYAAELAPELAGRCLVHAERIVRTLESGLWPESVLRDETLVVLGIDDLTVILAEIPPLDHPTALAEAAAWLADRDPREQTPRPRTEPFTPASP